MSIYLFCTSPRGTVYRKKWQMKSSWQDLRLHWQDLGVCQLKYPLGTMLHSLLAIQLHCSYIVKPLKNETCIYKYEQNLELGHVQRQPQGKRPGVCIHQTKRQTLLIENVMHMLHRVPVKQHMPLNNSHSQITHYLDLYSKKIGHAWPNQGNMVFWAWPYTFFLLSFKRLLNKPKATVVIMSAQQGLFAGQQYRQH